MFPSSSFRGRLSIGLVCDLFARLGVSGAQTEAFSESIRRSSAGDFPDFVYVLLFISVLLIGTSFDRRTEKGALSFCLRVASEFLGKTISLSLSLSSIAHARSVSSSPPTQLRPSHNNQPKINFLLLLLFSPPKVIRLYAITAQGHCTQEVQYTVLCLFRVF